MTMPMRYDALMIGAGSLGLWGAFWLSKKGRKVIVVERELGLGRLSTNQNARLWSALYFSNSAVAALTMASKTYLDKPPGRWFQGRIARPIDVFYLTTKKEEEANGDKRRNALYETAISSPSVESVDWRRLSPSADAGLIPQLAVEIAGGVVEKGRRLDVFTMIEGLRRGIEDAGGMVLDDTDILGIDKTANDEWSITTTNGLFQVPLVINAAGAKGDMIGRMFEVDPIGLQATKRHRIIAGVSDPRKLMALNRFVFLPNFYVAGEESGHLMMSGEDEVPCHPTDMLPDPAEATRILKRAREYLDASILLRGVRLTAGHRPFVADRTPVIGFERRRTDYAHLLAPGGYGMQAGAAMGKVLAAAVTGAPLPQEMIKLGLSLETFSVKRLRKTGCPTRA